MERIFSKSSSSTSLNVLSLPTRDGKSFSRSISESEPHCFKPTYKGWKAFIKRGYRDEEISRFKPTYKGWKFININRQWVEVYFTF